MEYKEFRVFIDKDSEIRIIKPSGISLKGTVRMDSLKKETLKVFSSWLAEDKITKRNELVVLGSYLYSVLFDDNISKEFKEEIDKVQNKPSTVLRLVLEFDEGAKELAEMPWEYIYYPDGSDRVSGFFIAAKSRLVLARQVPLKIEDLEPEEKSLRILIVVSNPDLDVDGKRMEKVNSEPVAKIIGEIKDSLPDIIKTEPLFLPTKRDLTNKINSYHPHVLHFIGHGRHDKDKGDCLALLKEKEKIADWISDKDLADCFMEYQPCLIFLHASQGSHEESYKTFRNIAMQLVYQKVPAVVAMQYQLDNALADQFAKTFYKSLSEGKPIDAAVQDGRNELAIYLEEQNFSSRAFGSPVVYLQTTKPIIKIQTGKGITIAQAQLPGEFSPTTSIKPTTVECPYNCGRTISIPTNLTKCPVCGKELKKCLKCGYINQKDDRFCGNPSCDVMLEPGPVRAGSAPMVKTKESETGGTYDSVIKVEPSPVRTGSTPMVGIKKSETGGIYDS